VSNFIGDIREFKRVQCSGCKHYIDNLVCGAFKKKIPNEILTGEHDHTKPYKGDNGIRFEPIEGTE